MNKSQLTHKVLCVFLKMVSRTSRATRNQRRLATRIAKEVANVITTVTIQFQTMQTQAPATTSRFTFKHAQNNKKKRSYNGTHPVCNRCEFHHANDSQCRLCRICGRYGHYTERCRELITQQLPALPSNRQRKSQYPPGSCFNCGDPTHYKNACPKLVNIIDTQAQANP